MASRSTRVSAATVIRHFQGLDDEEGAIPELFFSGSDDELGMEDYYFSSDEDQQGNK